MMKVITQLVRRPRLLGGLVATLFLVGHFWPAATTRISDLEVTATLTASAASSTVGDFRGTVESPAQLTGTTNNWAIGATTTYVRATSNASRTVTGIANGVNGRQLTICNVGSNDIVLDHENAASTNVNRLSMSGNIGWTLQGWTTGTDCIDFVYDGTTQRWRMRAYGSKVLPGPVFSGTTTATGSFSVSGDTTIGGHIVRPGTPSANHGSLATGSSNWRGEVTGIGANTSVVLTYSSAFTNRSRCVVSITSTAVAAEFIAVSTTASAATFSCFNSTTGAAANCDDFSYDCVGQ